MDIRPKQNYLDLTDFWLSPEWDITYSNVTRIERYYPCCKEPYPSVTYFMKLKRTTTIYRYTVFIPAIVAIILSLSSFWYPLRSTTRILLNSISLLVLTQLLLYLGFKLGFGSFGQPYAVRYLSLTTLAIGISLIWTTIGVNVSVLKFQPPLIAVKLIAPLAQLIGQNKIQETVGLTTNEDVLSNEKQSLSKPTAELVTLAIDKIVFVIFLLAVSLFHV